MSVDIQISRSIECVHEPWQSDSVHAKHNSIDLDGKPQNWFCYLSIRGISLTFNVKVLCDGRHASVSSTLVPGRRCVSAAWGENRYYIYFPSVRLRSLCFILLSLLHSFSGFQCGFGVAHIRFLYPDPPLSVNMAIEGSISPYAQGLLCVFLPN